MCMIQLKKRPLSIENRWDILYRDYPEVYDEFASVPNNPGMIEVLHERFDLAGKHDCFVEDAGFKYFDVLQTSYYGSLEKIIDTYGFIFGVKAIDNIKDHELTSIK